MKVPASQTLRVLRIGPETTTRNGNHFVECQTDVGLVAVWGSGANRNNILKLLKRSPPFTVVAGCIRPSVAHASRHEWWVPESAALVDAGTVSKLEPRKPQLNAYRPASPQVTVEQLGTWRRELMALLDRAEGERNRSSNEGVGQRINRLSHEGKVPRRVASLMRTVTEMRNAAEYESAVLSDAESNAVLSAWQAISEWAEGGGFNPA